MTEACGTGSARTQSGTGHLAQFDRFRTSIVEITEGSSRQQCPEKLMKKSVDAKTFPDVEHRFRGGRLVVLVPGSVNGRLRSNIDRSMSIESMAADNISQSALSVQERIGQDHQHQVLRGEFLMCLSWKSGPRQNQIQWWRKHPSVQHVGLHCVGWTPWISLASSPAEQW